MTYGKRAAAMPNGIYQTQDRMRAIGNDMAVVFSSHESVLCDHAAMIDEINNNLEKLAGFYEWVTETHPNILFQYKAIKDIQESANV
jgi:hypothetical protein